MCSLNLLHIFFPFTGANRLIFLAVVAVGKCDGNVLYLASAPLRVWSTHNVFPGVQFIYPKCGVRGFATGTFAPNLSRVVQNIGTRSKVHIIRLTFTIIIVRIPRKQLLRMRSIALPYKRR
jgi:hypothetical protein